MRILNNTPDFTTTYLPVIIATITGIVGTGLGLYNFIQRQKDRKPKFEQFKRKKDTVGGWYIYVGAPSKPVRRCNATFKGQKLQLRSKKACEETIPSGGGCNFDMPLDVSIDDDDFVIIRDGKRKLEKERFNEMITEGL